MEREELERNADEQEAQQDSRAAEPPSGGGDEDEAGPLGNPEVDEEAQSHGQQEGG